MALLSSSSRGWKDVLRYVLVCSLAAGLNLILSCYLFDERWVIPFIEGDKWVERELGTPMDDRLKIRKMYELWPPHRHFGFYFVFALLSLYFMRSVSALALHPLAQVPHLRRRSASHEDSLYTTPWRQRASLHSSGASDARGRVPRVCAGTEPSPPADRPTDRLGSGDGDRTPRTMFLRNALGEVEGRVNKMTFVSCKRPS
uniref:Mannosyltransferase n=1 Tax=Steinernema glaseri TaxID=37863 RepID=A0A1I7YD47_9BILA